MPGQVESVDGDALLFAHPLLQSCEAFLSGMLNEGHVFSEVLLSSNFSFFAPL